MTRAMQGALAWSEEVRQAVADGRPVVALESNVFCHGLRHPEGLETAMRVEAAVREAGAVPATLALQAGQILVGMSQPEMEALASAQRVEKVSSRDIAVVLAKGAQGATTVAACMAIAEIANLSVVASAGLGGVHRGASSSFDISADLLALTRYRGAMVCAGAKSILDLRLTLEFLETHGVPVVSYRADDFPAFYCRSSGLRSPQRLDCVDAMAHALRLHLSLDAGAMLVTAPIEQAAALPQEAVEAAICAAIRDAEAQGVAGNRLTPYLMRAVEAATEGRSTAANKAVLISTARLAGQLAAAYARRAS